MQKRMDNGMETRMRERFIGWIRNLLREPQYHILRDLWCYGILRSRRFFNSSSMNPQNSTKDALWKVLGPKPYLNPMGPWWLSDCTADRTSTSLDRDVWIEGLGFGVKG